MQQQSDAVFMMRPAAFDFNPETAPSNAFQQEGDSTHVLEKVCAEFDAMVARLRENGIHVFVFEDTLLPKKPDAIFPNNWISLHHDGRVVLYTMLAKNRRTERRIDILEKIQTDFVIKQLIDISDGETEEVFLEGTGSIVFDHQKKIAFACRSPRTNENLLKKLCAEVGYTAHCFDAFDSAGKAIYHTNVLMAIGKNWSVCCLDSVHEKDRERLKNQLENNGSLVEISFEQMNHFAGNMLGLSSASGDFIVLSQSAFDALNMQQKEQLKRAAKLLPIAIPTIEKHGGGSVRCMLAEVFLPKKEKE